MSGLSSKVLPLEKVLVATDLSPASGKVLARTSRLPLAPGAEITIVHVSADRPADRESRGAIERLAAGLAEALARRGGAEVAVRVEVVEGSPQEQIARSALAGGADLVVVGRRGQSDIRGFFLGSTAEQVVRKSEKPVLVVEADPAGPYARPLLAVDTEASAEKLLEHLLAVCGTSVREIAAVHAIEEIPIGDPLVAGVGPVEEHQYYEGRDTAAARVFQVLEGILASRGCQLSPVIVTGKPEVAVVQTATTLRADLVVIGTRGRAGIPRLLLGSVAAAVLREAPSDVLVVPMAGTV